MGSAMSRSQRSRHVSQPEIKNSYTRMQNGGSEYQMNAQTLLSGDQTQEANSLTNMVDSSDRRPDFNRSEALLSPRSTTMYGSAGAITDNLANQRIGQLSEIQTTYHENMNLTQQPYNQLTNNPSMQNQNDLEENPNNSLLEHARTLTLTISQEPSSMEQRRLSHEDI